MDERDTRIAHDAATEAYFDAHVPEYSVTRFAHVERFLHSHAGPGSSLIDVG